MVYGKAGHFAGWPANNGLWHWGGIEVLVAFSVGAFREQPGHNIEGPIRTLLARSLDQGETWVSDGDEPFAFQAAPRPLATPLAFESSGAALRVVGTGYHGSDCPSGAFFQSSDRGRSWRGPFALTGLLEAPELAGWEITARTDVLEEGPQRCLMMLSARNGGWLTDRTFCARTTDGGRTFQFVAWVVPPSDPARAVMPATVSLRNGGLVTLLRRRLKAHQGCWIEAFGSSDQGSRWRSLGRVAHTGEDNGNPPALCQLVDGRLCCVVGDRRRHWLLAYMSRDGGQSWGEKQVLRADFCPDRFGDADLGYPRLCQRADGQLLALYYWATIDRPEQHIAATIWAP